MTMSDRQREEQAARKALAASLKKTAPALFGAPSLDSPPLAPPRPEPQQPREALPGFGSAVLGPIEAAERVREEAERRAAEEARRAADPYSDIEDKINTLAPRMFSQEVLALNETLQRARDERAAGDHKMADLYAEECRQYLDETEALGDES
jgi:hypothetical protein